MIACTALREKSANPVRIIVICDDLQLAQQQSKNNIESFTYSFCNLYYGWPDAVKIPHVIKYADKIAEQYANIEAYIPMVNASHNRPAGDIDKALHCI